MTPARLQYLLEKYLDGTATEAEAAEYAQWYDQPQAASPPVFTQTEVDQVYHVIAVGIKGKKINYWRFAAAAAIIMAMGSLWIFNTTDRNIRKQVAVKESVHADTITIRNTHGINRDVALPDGSLVTLYNGAEVRYATPFGAKDRIVLLKGKGFFNVTKNAPSPFTVLSQDVATTALGTSFTITNAGNKVKVLLHTGKVMVKGKMKTIYLTPGQLVTCETGTGITHLRTQKIATRPIVEKKPVIVWGSLRGFTATFDQTPLSDVFDTIEKGYHIKISVQAAVYRDIAFSGVIRDTDSLAQVLHRIAMLHDLRITSTHTGYRIEKNH
ncbi:FecR domain-containing protein [Chitinophaga sp. MM2321]|uniref:FecR family protein n=1 Tax=Chitinophaga sp. MM2321 TaxID=3137178 RepID=UPI0032D57733